VEKSYSTTQSWDKNGKMVTERFIDGSTLLGVSLTMFGVGTIVQGLWQKLIMFTFSFAWLIIAYIAFVSKKK
jgi:hypothetical protein